MKRTLLWLFAVAAVAAACQKPENGNNPDGKTLMFASTLARKCVFTDLEGKPLKVISRTGIAYRSHYFEDVTF